MNNASPLVSMEHIAVKIGGNTVRDDISLEIGPLEHWAVLGESGSGKTTMAMVLAGKIFHSGTLSWNPAATISVGLVEQQHHFKNLQHTTEFYYQQRFNASESADSETVAEHLGPLPMPGWLQLLELENLMSRPLLQLSNGENKRLQLAKTLMAGSTVLVLDNPFLGLDADGRERLHHVLDRVAAEGIHLIIMTSSAELPKCITHVATLHEGVMVSAQPKTVYFQNLPAGSTGRRPLNRVLLGTLPNPDYDDFDLAIDMREVTVRYDEKIILNNINWQVRKGECWNVAGPNGAGKSTLLSLITADNPQAYANDIRLFDKQRGSGESIWDIKKKIGFVSPELHLYFEQQATCFEVVASGLFDTIGLFRRLSGTQSLLVRQWLELVGLSAFSDKRLFQLSASQQRMALLARALIKNPPLLILDEPTQGLDADQTAWFKELIDEICLQFHSTLLYVSHYTADLPACIKHFLYLKNGNILST